MPCSRCRLRDQVEHLALHRDVERRDRLVGDDERRVERERPRDADPLALAAGELVGVAVLHRLAQADDVEQFLHALRALGGRADPVHVERLADGLGDGAARAERRVGILEDDLHLAAPREQLLARQRRDVLARSAVPGRRSVPAA